MKKISLSQKFLKRVLIILLIGQALTMMAVYRDRMQVENGELTNRNLVGGGSKATPSQRNGSYRPGKPLFD